MKIESNDERLAREIQEHEELKQRNRNKPKETEV